MRGGAAAALLAWALACALGRARVLAYVPRLEPWRADSGRVAARGRCSAACGAQLRCRKAMLVIDTAIGACCSCCRSGLTAAAS